MSEIAQTDNFNDKTSIKVVGVGGAGGNAVNRMIAEGLQNVQFVAVNTDAKDLLRSEADVKISLSDNNSRGGGGGAAPAKGAQAAPDHQSDIEEAIKGSDMVFVTAGEGGGTGTGASPLVARAARQLGALTIAVVTRPFTFEGPRRASSAESGIENLRKEVDALIVIPNDRLLDLSDRTVSVIDAFKTADTAL
ncbi:MAG: cell division protein FtsZ, partial [Bifidobacterium crudilactis]|nr:cell division protein FtsZ [Bifidobacterium crudilactis]